MYIKIVKNKNSQKVYLFQSFRNINGEPRQRIIKKYGELKKLIAKDPNVIEKLKKEAKQITENEKISLHLDINNSILQAKKSKNYGFFFLDSIYKQLKIDEKINEFSKTQKFKYDLNSILKMLVFGRILKPTSKLKTCEKQDWYLGDFKNTLTDTYRSLEVLSKIKDDLQVNIHQELTKKYKRDCSLVLYDVTNYYFETENEDELKRSGVSKEKKRNPIVQMGLLIDKNKIPIGYQLFPGNTHDSKTAIPMIDELRKNFKLKKIIFVADKGINTTKNFAYLASKGDGYIVSQKIRGSKKELMDIVLNKNDYTYVGSKFKYKEILRDRKVENDDGTIILLKEKIIIFWSENFDLREKHKRKKLVDKINKYLKSPAALKASNSFGIKRYLKTIKVNKKTGEILQGKDETIFNEAKYQRDINLDGYYSIVTSEIDKPIGEIINSYRELWKIEESFKVIKSDLEGRPIYVRRNDHIEGHFLTCFIALVILRILEYKLSFKYSASKIKEDLADATCKEISSGYYSVEPLNNVIQELEKEFDSFITSEIITHEKLRKHKKNISTYT